MAELVVGRPLLRVGQHFVGLVGLLEMLLGLRVVRIAVRMPLHGQLPVGLLDVLFGRVPVYAEHLVVVALRHASAFPQLPAQPAFLSLTSVYSASTTLPSSFFCSDVPWPPAACCCSAALRCFACSSA